MHIHCGVACDEQQTIPFITPRADKKAPGGQRWPRFFFVLQRALIFDPGAASTFTCGSTRRHKKISWSY
jgi:hypothetical protein